MYRHFFKRFFDIVCSFFGILVFAIPMVIIAIAVRCDSKGPALFISQRAGKNCKPFKFYKFRSMRTDAPKDVATRLLKSEDYITKVGAFLRKTSLDELPQLFCIFVGTMSIVGPRPTVFSEEDLIAAREKYNANGVRPGLTGLAQVNGRDVLASDVEKKAWYDGEYCKKITLIGDAKIFFKTIVQVFRGEGIVEGDAVLKENQAKEESAVKAEQPADDNAVTVEKSAEQGGAEIEQTDNGSEEKI